MTVPDPTLPGSILATFETTMGWITFSTSGITDADRVQFGYAPGAFAADGTSDTVLHLSVSDTAPTPEPASILMVVTGIGLIAIKRARG